jgi:MFS family permease
VILFIPTIWSCGQVDAKLKHAFRRFEQHLNVTTADSGTAAPRASDLLMPVYVPAALLAFGQGLLLTVLPLYAASLGTSYGIASLIVAAAALGTLITDVPAGAVLSRIGLRPAMWIGASLVAIGTAGLVIDGPVSFIAGLRVFAGIGTALWGLSRHAFIASATIATERGRAISVFGGINRMGMLAGPAVGGAIATAFGFDCAFLASAAMAAIALAVAVRYVSVDSHDGRGISGRDRWALVRKVVKVNRKDLGAAGIAQTLAQMIRAGRQFILPIYGASVIGLSAAQIGFIVTVASILDVAMFVPAGILMDRFGRKVAAVPSFAVMGIGVGMIPFTSSYLGLLVAACVIGFGNGIGSGTMMTLGADLAPRGATGEFLGIWRLIGDAGAFLGPIAVGVIASSTSLSVSAYLLSAIGISATFTLAFLVKETRVTTATVVAQNGG